MCDEATHFLLFIRKDKYVSNCPSSIYRVKWIKEYFKGKIDVIVWKNDLIPNGSDYDNLIALTERLNGNVNNVSKYIGKKDPNFKLPIREMCYNFCNISNVLLDKKSIMLVGVVPHLLDPYRKTDLMDYLYDKVNIVLPQLVKTNYKLEEKCADEILFYKEKAIISAINKCIDENMIDGFLFISDPFDLPGKFSFPVFKMELEKNGIRRYSDDNPSKIKYLDLVVTINNIEKTKQLIEEFVASI